uniref:Putative ring-cleaving dioxygenase n=1 Tax=Paulinella micropora TaxID=1928728 RepID=A0A385I150_9EUKA|nr:putative ring-cleaving dioxygenase [Paulinella micropora]AXY63595.1 putative ring-cleaving dioxygenase [Paulinella micropora]
MTQFGHDSQGRIIVHRLGHVAIRVQDMNRAKNFYQGLGLSLVWDATDWAYLRLANSNNGIALLSPEYKDAGPHFAFHFSTKEEIELIRLQFIDKGYEVGAIHDHRDGTSSFYLQDPESNWLEILYEPTEGIHSN